MICEFVYQHTHHVWLADLAKVVITRPLPILTILAVSVLTRWVLHRAIGRVVRQATAGPVRSWQRLHPRARRALADIVPVAGERRLQRAKTLGSVLRSIVSVVVYSTATVMILEQLGVNLAPLIASASIVGVALGFGAQSLVKDVLSGAFALLEDQYGVGDVVNVDGTSGVVEAVGLRSTRIRDVHGAVWHVRAGDIQKVGNFSQEWARALLDVTVDYRTDVDTAVTVIQDAADALAADPDYADLILEPPQVWGVEDYGADALTIRLVVKTVPLRQWDVARGLRRRLRYAFDAAGISVAAPRHVVSLEHAATADRSLPHPDPRAETPRPSRPARPADPADKLRP